MVNTLRTVTRVFRENYLLVGCDLPTMRPCPTEKQLALCLPNAPPPPPLRPLPHAPVPLGQHVEDLRRGLVRIVGVSDGPIQWPIGQTRRAKSLVLYRGLARAVRREPPPRSCTGWA